jgi:hypothetical protein
LEGEMKIDVSYDGKYPNLCSGHLVVIIDGVKWDFGEHCLSSGGSVSFDDNWNENVASGPWSISKWPDGFLVALEDVVTEAVNEKIRHGCCGGCV